MTIREAINDIELRLGQDSSNPKVPRKQIWFELDMARSRMLNFYFERNGMIVTDDMVKWFDCQVQKTVEDCDGCEEQVIELPGQVYDLPDEGGVVAVLRPGGNALPRFSNAGEYSILKKSRYSTKEGYYKKANQLKLIGSFPLDMKFSVGIILSRTDSLALDDTFPMVEAYMSEVLNETEQVLRRQIERGIVAFSDNNEATT